MKKGKILHPILFALALVMVFSVLGVAPAYAGCRHSYNSDSVYIRSNNRNDYFKVTKVCTKCHKRTSVTRSLAHSYTYGGKIEQYYGADKFHDYFYVYKKCIRYNMCHHKVFYNKEAKNHDYRKIRIKRIRQGKKTLTQTRYKCARCGRIMSKIS